jgi:hypothetical protein
MSRRKGSGGVDGEVSKGSETEEQRRVEKREVTKERAEISMEVEHRGYPLFRPLPALGALLFHFFLSVNSPILLTKKK